MLTGECQQKLTVFPICSKVAPIVKSGLGSSMLRRKIAETDYGADSFYVRRRWRGDAMPRGETAARVPIGFGPRLTSFVILCTLVFACWAQNISRAQTSGTASDQPSDAERAAYADALAFCRGSSPSLVTLRADKRVLCFDGQAYSQSDILLANGLEHGGIFVARSQGGDVAATIALADLLLLKNATVVINDYCLQACADYLFMATARTFVPKDALVAWTLQLSDQNNCLGFSKTSDPRAPRAAEVQCPGSLAAPRQDNPKRTFYVGRVVTAPEPPPESIAIRRILKRKFDKMGRFPDNTYWTWNPRYYASTIKTKIFNEAYPHSQDEVDAIVKRLGLAISVIYDP